MIDWTRVTALRDEVGTEDFEEVVELFIEEVDEVVGHLRNDSRMNTLEEDMHFLKGSALNLGFTDLARLCEAGEQAAAAGHDDRIDVAAVIAAYDASRDTFLAERATRLAA